MARFEPEFEILRLFADLHILKRGRTADRLHGHMDRPGLQFFKVKWPSEFVRASGSLVPKRSRPSATCASDDRLSLGSKDVTFDLQALFENEHRVSAESGLGPRGKIIAMSDSESPRWNSRWALRSNSSAPDRRSKAGRRGRPNWPGAARSAAY